MENYKEFEIMLQLFGDIETVISKYYNKDGIDDDKMQRDKISDILFVLSLMLKKLAVVSGLSNKKVVQYIKEKMQDKGLESMIAKTDW